VHGTVQAESIHVAGTVRGELHADDTLVLGASSDVEARLQADALTIESGADFKGTVHDDNGPFVPSLERDSSGDHRPPPVVSMGLAPTLESVPPAEEDDAHRDVTPEENGQFVSVWDRD
jgi:hypothetical protein